MIGLSQTVPVILLTTPNSQGQEHFTDALVGRACFSRTKRERKATILHGEQKIHNEW